MIGENVLRAPREVCAGLTPERPDCSRMAAKNEEGPSGRRKGPIEEDGEVQENQSGRDRDSPVLEESVMVESSPWEADPVVCVERVLRVGSENLRKIPAVKIVLSEEEWAIVPLSLNELGVLFDTTMAFKDWGYYTVPGGWEEAHETFLKLIDYSPSFLDVFLKALREGCLPGGEPLHLGTLVYVLLGSRDVVEGKSDMPRLSNAARINGQIPFSRTARPHCVHVPA